MSVSCALVGHDIAGETTVSGAVLRDGEPARVAYIQVRRENGEMVSEARCAPAGSFTIPILPGRWQVTCLAPGARALRQVVEVVRGDQFRVEFALEPGR